MLYSTNGETAVCYHRHGKLTTNAKAAAVLKCVQSWKAPEHDAVLVQGGILKGRAEQLHSLIIAFFH